MTSENDNGPIIINTGITIVTARWSPNGLLLAVCGYVLEENIKRNVV